MPPVTVLILFPELAPAAGPLARALDAGLVALAARHRDAFLAAGATDVAVRREPADDTPFGARLRRLTADLDDGGLVVLGAGAIPLAGGADYRSLVEAAAAASGALANHRHSADVVAVARARAILRDVPDLPSDNALPRWLAEHERVPVRDLARRRHLAVDVDTPLDLVLLAGLPGLPDPPDELRSLAGHVRDRRAALARVARDPGAELLVAGRTSATDLRWLERHTACRVRALVEERGLRTAGAAALAGRPNRRPPRSVLGTLLDRDGPSSLGAHLAALSDGALVDTRVLLAHRLGADERAWPAAEDRYASDLLLADRIRDPWLAELTRSAADAPLPVLLGGHTLVGPGARNALGRMGHR